MTQSISHYMGDLKREILSFVDSTVPEIHLSYLIDSSDMLNDVPRWPLYLHLISAVICMGISATFHLFYCHGPKCNRVFSRLDYAGISLLIGGTNLSPNYYALYCKEF